MEPSSIVDPGYRHVDKYASRMPGSTHSLSWYEIREPDRTIDPQVELAAREHAAREIESGDEGFVLLHLCGEAFYFLLVCRWRNGNELWETVFARSDGEAGFSLVDPDSTFATFCVWELAVVAAQRTAWIDYLRSERTEADLSAYRDFTFEGTV